MVTPAALAERWLQCKAAACGRGHGRGRTRAILAQWHGAWWLTSSWGGRGLGWATQTSHQPLFSPAGCSVVGCVAASAILFCGLAGLHGLPGVAAWPATLPDAKRPPTLRRARTACSAYSFSRIAASVPAHGIGDCARTVRSNLSGFEDRTNGLTMSVLHRVGYRPQIARCVFAWSEHLSHHTCIEVLQVGVRSHGVQGWAEEGLGRAVV